MSCISYECRYYTMCEHSKPNGSNDVDWANHGSALMSENVYVCDTYCGPLGNYKMYIPRILDYELEAESR